jgi:hypothetical protein
MQLIQFSNVSLFSMVITNHFIGIGVTLTQISLDGYEAMGFGIMLLIQDQEQRLFTIQAIIMPIQMSVYGDSFTHQIFH